MAKEINAVYDPNSTWKPIEEGQYPAHIKSLATKEVNTKAGEAIVVNMTYKIADEAADLEQLVYEMDGFKYKRDQDNNRIPVANGNGEQATTDCGHLVGRDVWDNGWFIFTSSESGSKNRKVKKLVLIEEEDVKGKPVLVDLRRQEYVTSDTKHLPPEQQEWRTSFKVMGVKPWEGGDSLSVDEIDGDDVPF